MNRVSHHQGAMVTHEEDVLVPQNLPQPLPLIYHIWRLVSCVPGTPVFEPEMLSIDLQTDNLLFVCFSHLQLFWWIINRLGSWRHPRAVAYGV